MATVPRFARVNPEEVAAQVIDGEAIIINMATGVYYSLAGVGAEVWSLLETTGDVDRTVTAIAARYDVDHGQARADVERLVGEFLAERLVLVANEPVGPDEAGELEPTMGRAYAAPVLQAYRDMNELMALDPPVPGLTPISWDEPAPPRRA